MLGTTRKHTLLHYLTEIISQKFKNVDGFEKEIATVEGGSKGTIFARQ